MNRKAVALVFTFVVAVVLVTLGSVVVSRSVSESQMVKRSILSQQSFWLAEAGIQRALWELNYGGGSWAGWTDISGDKSITVTLGSVGDCYVEVTNPTGNNPQVVARGVISGIDYARGLEADIVLDKSNFFKYAVFGKSLVTLSDDIKIDSYDSGIGAYGGDNRAVNGDIGTNGRIGAVITLQNNVAVKGDASTGPGGVIYMGDRRSRRSTIEGEQTHDNNENYPSVIVPTYLEGLSNSGVQSVAGNSNVTLSSGTYKFSSIDVSGNGILNLQGPMEIYLTETASSALDVLGNGSISISGEVIIYTEGKCAIDGNGVDNTSNLPQNFIIYSKYSGGGTGVVGVNISGNNDLYGVIYAPDTKILLDGNNLYGAMIGDILSIHGNVCTNSGNVHYDEVLSSLNGVGLGSYVIASWKEEKNSYEITP